MLRTLAAALILSSFLPSRVQPQDLRYSMVTRSELGGAAGRILGVVPGGTEPVQETTFIKGNRIRKDDGSESSNIMDWDSGILTILDHQDRSYVQLSMEEMAQAAEEVVRSMEEEGGSSGLKDAMVDGSREGAEEVEDAHSDAGGGQTAVDITVSSDRTGVTRDFSGYSAEQVLVTLEILGEHTPGDYGEEEQSGGLAIITELWLSQDFPEYRMMQEMNGEALDRMRERETGQGILGSLEALTTYDPRLEIAFEKNQETVDAMDGVALRTAVHVVTLPGRTPVDRNKVLADQDRSLSDDAAEAAASGAKDAARSAASRIGGRLFGRGKKEEASPKPEEPQQSVILRIISEVSDVETLDLEPALFDPPPDYSLRTEGGSSGSGS